MSQATSGPSLRASSDHFLVGSAQPDLGKDARQGKLPLTRSVLQYFFHRKNLPEFKSKTLDQIICCNLSRSNFIADCENNPNCKDSSECVVKKVKNDGNWLKAGIPIISDQAILKKVKKLHDEYKTLAKNKNKPNSNLLQREKYSEILDELFDISVPGADSRLMMDRLRQDQARQEDLEFLADQRDVDRRKMCVGKQRDVKYEKAILDKALRESRSDRVKPITNNNFPMETEIDEEKEDSIHDDGSDDFVPEKRKKKDNLVTLTVDKKKLAKETAITAKRHKVGITAQRDMLANVINVGGGNVADFSLSNKTVRRAGAKSVKEAAVKIKSDFKKVVVEKLGEKECLIVYFDGKALPQFHDQIKCVKKRLSVIADSPYLSTEQVLGVPITPSNSGRDQMNVVMKVLKDWEIEPYVMGLAFDTTSDNTGRNKGAVVLIEKALGRAVWWVACSHHFYEVHVKKVARLYFGETSCPEETVYKKLKDEWNKIIEEEIDYEDLELFDWEKWDNTYLADRAREVLVYLESLKKNNTFPREDMKELLNLVLVWLGGKVDNFTFQYPGAMSHARFLMQSIYSLKIYLLSRQLEIYSGEELEQIKSVALFVGLFHAPWYFMCPLASSAPQLHLSTIHQMKKLQRFLPALAKVVLEIISLHLWYLTPQSIPLALADESLSVDQRSSIAVGLSRIPRQEVLPMGKPSFPDLSSWPDRFWVKDKLPELSSMLGPGSWLLFDKLGFTEEDLSWLLLDPHGWDSNPGYNKFRDFVRGLTIVNDPAERGVGLVKQFISTFQNEESCQENLLAVSQHRKIVSKDSKKEDLTTIGLN